MRAALSLATAGLLDRAARPAIAIATAGLIRIVEAVEPPRDSGGVIGLGRYPFAPRAPRMRPDSALERLARIAEDAADRAQPIPGYSGTEIDVSPFELMPTETADPAPFDRTPIDRVLDRYAADEKARASDLNLRILLLLAADA